VRKILFISRHAPYGNSLSREALDAILAASAYDQELSLLFMDDGVFQLHKEQNAVSITQKNMASSLEALELYGIDNIYCHKRSLDKRGLSPSDLILEQLIILDDTQINQLMTQQDQLLSF
jgi:tRNA 2-thiouridine synthesizing protein C